MNEPDRHSWATSEVEDLGGGVHRIPLPLPDDGLRAVNVYAIVDEHGATLIDAGMALAVDRDALGRALLGLGLGFGDVRGFYVTHFHRDHYPLSVEIRRVFGTPVWLGEEEWHNIRVIQKLPADDSRSIDSQLRESGAAELVDELVSMRPDDDERERHYEDPDGWLADGARIRLPGRSLDVHATPGHTRGHVVYADAAAGVLFAGDHVLPHITPSIGFEPAGTGRALSDYLMSLAKIRALPDFRLLPAHGPVVDSSHRRIDELLDHHEVRLAQALAACGTRPRTAFDVAHELPWTRRQTPFARLTVFDQALAVTETQAHLRLLAARSRLTGTLGPDGILRYVPRTSNNSTDQWVARDSAGTIRP